MRSVDLLEQASVLRQVAVAEKLGTCALPCLGAQPLRLGPVAKERVDQAAEARQVERVLDQQAVLAVDDLIDDPAYRARDDWPRLPHRLRDREAEALGDALLHDNRCMAL